MSHRVLVVALVLLLPAWAATPSKKKKPAKPATNTNRVLASRIDKLLDEGVAAQAHWGVLVVDLKDGRVVYARNEHRLFAPASNTKLFTTATALETLGPGYKFRTTLESVAPPNAQGEIAGDLVLVGRGDPNLSHRVLPFHEKTEVTGPPTVALDRFADQLAASGGRTIAGDVIGDDTY